MKHSGRTLAVIWVVLAATLSAWAYPPPGWHEKAKQEATEHLNLRIVRLEQVSVAGKIEIEAEAEVTKIHRNKSQRLAVGDVVVIQYYRHSKHKPMPPGPGDPMAVSIEEEYEAYLNRSKRIRGYVPAVAGHSFKKLERVQAEKQGNSRESPGKKLQATAGPLRVPPTPEL